MGVRKPFLIFTSAAVALLAVISVEPELPASAAVIAGYTVVSSAVTVPADSQTPGSVSCPANELPVGGGAYTSLTFDVWLNTSQPLSNGWYVVVDDETTSPVVSDTYVVCANKPKHYVVESSTSDNPPNSYAYGLATCPKTAPAVLGGGAGSSSNVAGEVSLQDAFPNRDSKYDFHAASNNQSPADNTLTTYAICGSKPKKYALMSSAAPGSLPAGSIGSAQTLCPGTTRPLGGGPAPNGPYDIDYSVSQTYPSGGSWQAAENNGSATGTILNVNVACAAT